MTSHTGGIAAHTPDSDLIDEPSPANTDAHGYSHTHTHTGSSVRRSRRTYHHHTGWNGPRRGNDIGESDD